MGLNIMILSLLFNTHPRDVKLLLIDPKRLELSVYEDIPHLIEPVVTESKKAGEALASLVAEMERRYHLLAAAGARNIESYNAMIDAGQGAKTRGAKSGVDSPPAERIPYVVVVIDELADLMMVSARRVEEAIARLAQMARAAGIHLIRDTAAFGRRADGRHQGELPGAHRLPDGLQDRLPDHSGLHGRRTAPGQG